MIKLKSSIMSLLIILILSAVTVFNVQAAAEQKKVSKKENTADYSGIYEISDPDICRLSITIKKKGKGYTYIIKGTGVDSSGKLTVEKSGDQTYLNFNSTRRSGDKSAVTGLYDADKITIQNYGNSMNQYICFKKCDAKYIELVKVK